MEACNTMKGSEAIVKTLIQKGIKHVFGITGGAIIPFYDSLYDYPDDIQNLLCRHEQGATHMAAGYARITGTPAVAVGTSGPGGTNLLTGIMDAYMDSTPMIAMAGQVPLSLIGRDAFQETDMIGLTMPITKHNFQVRDPNKLAETIIKAYKISVTGRPGPVYIDLPKDVQSMEVTKPIPKDVKIRGLKAPPKPDIRKIKKAVEYLLDAQRPLLLLGGGVIISGASREAQEFANMAFLPTSTTTMAKGSFPETNPLSLGVTGMHGTEHANWAIINTDCLIAIGTRFSDRITGDLSLFAQEAKVIHIDVDPSEINKNVQADIGIVADAREALKMLIVAFTKAAGRHNHKHSEWRKKIVELKDISHSFEERDIKGMTQANLVTMLSKFIERKDIVVTGVGQHQMFGEHFLTLTEPRTWVTSGGAGTMGYGFPASLGVKLAAPKAEVYDIDGDGCFQMTAQELATAKQYGIKTTPIIMNNGYLGMVRQWLELFKEKRYSGVEFTYNPDFVKLAEAYSLRGVTVTRESEYVEALALARKEHETFIINCHVEKEENILPMLPPGKGLQHIIGGKHLFKQSWKDVM